MLSEPARAPRALRSSLVALALSACAGAPAGDAPIETEGPVPTVATDRPGEDSVGASDVPATAPDPAVPTPPSPPAGHAWVVFGADTIVAEVAATPEQRAVGLMNRTDLPENGGMLFLFERVEHRSFWMRDTPLDLDVAFMEDGYRIVQIETMEANSLTLHDSEQPVFAALEVHGGWLAAHGVEVGDVPEVWIAGESTARGR